MNVGRLGFTSQCRRGMIGVLHSPTVPETTTASESNEGDSRARSAESGTAAGKGVPPTLDEAMAARASCSSAAELLCDAIYS
jgi:hypothetical protein